MILHVFKRLRFLKKGKASYIPQISFIILGIGTSKGGYTFEVASRSLCLSILLRDQTKYRTHLSAYPQGCYPIKINHKFFSRLQAINHASEPFVESRFLPVVFIDIIPIICTLEFSLSR